MKEQINKVEVQALITFPLSEAIRSLKTIPHNLLDNSEKIATLKILQTICEEEVRLLPTTKLSEEIEVKESVTKVLVDKKAESIAQHLLKLKEKFSITTAKEVLKKIQVYKGDTAEILNIQLLIGEFPELEALDFLKQYSQK